MLTTTLCGLPPIDSILTCTTTLGQNGPESNNNKGYSTLTPHSSRTGASFQDAV